MRVLCLVLLLATWLPAPVGAQTAAVRSTDQSPRWWLDVNFLNVMSAQDADPRNGTMFKSFQPVPASITITYPKLGSTFSIGLDGGMIIGRNFGAGVHYSAERYDGSVQLFASVPHPQPGGVSASAMNDVAFQPIREQRTLDIDAAYCVVSNAHLQVRLFGGPTFFRFTQQRVTDFSIGWDALDQAGAVNVIHISNAVHHDEFTGHTWGFNVGADFAYYFKPAIGVGGVIRYNQGTFGTVDPVTGQSANLALGHLMVGTGVRLRFHF